MSITKKVCILLFGDFHSDNRVIKEVKSISKVSSVDIFYLTNRKAKNTLGIKNTKEHQLISLSVNKMANLFFGMWYMLIKILLTHKRYDIIWANDFDTLLIACILKFIYKSKLIYDSHELWFGKIPFRIRNWRDLYARLYLSLYLIIEKICIRYTDAIISVNDDLRDLLIERYPFIRNKPNIVIHNYPEKVNKIKIKTKVLDYYSFVFFGLSSVQWMQIFIGALNLLNKKDRDKIRVKVYTRKKNFNIFILPLIKRYKLKSIISYGGFIPSNAAWKYLLKSDFGLVIYPKLNLNFLFPDSVKFYEYLRSGTIPITNIKYLGDKCPDGVIYTSTYTQKGLFETLKYILKMKKSEMLKLRKNALKCGKKYVWEDKKVKNLIRNVSDN